MAPSDIPRIPGPLFSPAKKMRATCWPMPEIPRANAWRLQGLWPDQKKGSNSPLSPNLQSRVLGAYPSTQRDPEKFRIRSQYLEMCSPHEGSEHSNSHGKCQSVSASGRERTYWPQSSKSRAHHSQDLPSRNGQLPPACAIFLQRGLTDLNWSTNAFYFWNLKAANSAIGMQNPLIQSADIYWAATVCPAAF